MTTIPRPEHPRPQFIRKEWINLNGQWTFEFDLSESGIWQEPQVMTYQPAVYSDTANRFDPSKLLLRRGPFSRTINVPFCPESKLSGVEFTDFIPAMIYARTIDIPEHWNGRRIILHFGGVDNISSVFIDGKFAGRHKGGQCSFEFDITSFVTPGSSHLLTLYVTDHIREGLSGSGKQAVLHQSSGCHYTRVTGIWSTVWLEAVAHDGLKRCRTVPDFDNGSFVFTPEFYAVPEDGKLEIELFADGISCGKTTVSCSAGVPVFLAPDIRREWNPEDPFLYDIIFRVIDADGKIIDTVHSYAGLRKIAIVKKRFYLNNQPFFPRFVLDQGYYPEGVWTAPDDNALKKDIELAKAAGFNGARLHQKVFEERYHYWADKLGFLTWGEYGNWGLHTDNAAARENFLAEWQEIVLRDMNHPSIITWCPMNETIQTTQNTLTAQLGRLDQLNTYRDWITAVYDMTKAIDPSRPFHDCSGYIHVKTDIWSVHPYCIDAEALKNRMFPEHGGVMSHVPELEVPYNGQPYVCDEFGGFKYIPPECRSSSNSWGYHDLDLKTPEDLCSKIAEQVEFLINAPEVSGYCYTQHTDVEQEQNGIYNYDRSPKAPSELFYAVFSRKPDWSRY